MKQDYENRIRVLEERLQNVESSESCGPTRRPETATARTGGKTTSNAFNPAISLILDGKFASLSKDPTTYALPGFARGAGNRSPATGFRLGESELVMSANVDDKFYGQFTAALTAENTTEVEEAYLNPVTRQRLHRARRALLLRHRLSQWVARARLGFRRPAARLPRPARQPVQGRWRAIALVAPTDLFMEFGAEAFRGGNFPAGGAAGTARAPYGIRAHRRRCRHQSRMARRQISRLKAESANRATTNGSATDLFTGTGELTGVDFVWKWAPNGNPKQRNFKFQTEYFTRDENGTFDPASAGTPLAYRGKQNGWYAQGDIPIHAPLARGATPRQARIRWRECGACRVGAR